MSEAQYALGLHLRDGVGVARSLGEATQSFQLASAQGHVKASFELGCLLEEGGPGVTLDGLPNLRAARCAFEKAATLVRCWVEMQRDSISRVWSSGILLLLVLRLWVM